MAKNVKKAVVKRDRANVSATDFVQAVLSSSSHAEVARKTGLKVTSVATRLTTLRKRGVNVPNFRRGGNGVKLDVNSLNALIAASQA